MPISEALAAFRQEISQLYEDVESGKIHIAEIEGASTSLSRAMLLNTYLDILRRIDEGDLDTLGRMVTGKYSELRQGEYFKRKESWRSKLFGQYNDASRSYAIIVENGRFKAFIETKSKFPDNTKRRVRFPFGNFKKCKVAFRVDVWPFIPCAALISEVNGNTIKADDIIIEKYIKEVNLNNALAAKDPKFFTPMLSIIDDEDDDRNPKIRTYMEHVQFDLFSVLRSEITLPGYKGDPQLDRTLVKVGKYKIEAWRIDLMNQMLQAVSAVHAAKIVHRDLKPENVLCVYDPISKRFAIKIIDFGLAKSFGYQMNGLAGTRSYIPPEMYLHYVEDLKDPSEKTKSLIEASALDDKQELPKGVVSAIDMIKMSEETGNAWTAVTDKKFGDHDMWSLGIVFSELLEPNLKAVNKLNTRLNRLLSIVNNIKNRAGKLVKSAKISPTPLPLDELLQGLLNPNAATRLNIEQAQQKMNEIMSVVEKQDPALAANLRTIPETKPIAVTFEQPKILQKALVQFNEWIITGTDKSYLAADAELSKYISKLYIVDEPDFIDKLNLYKSNIKERRDDLQQLEKLQEHLTRDLKKVWYSFVDENGGTHEDYWVAGRLEKRLMMLLLNDLTAMAIAYKKQDPQTAGKIFAHMQAYAQTTAELIESHSKKPFRYRFNARG